MVINDIFAGHTFKLEWDSCGCSLPDQTRHTKRHLSKVWVITSIVFQVATVPYA